MEIEKKIDVSDLNNQGENLARVITLTVQEPDIIKFSALCEEKFKLIHPEALINYSINNIPMQTGGQIALIFVATFQYWAGEAEHKQWVNDLKKEKLLIKL